MSSVDHSTTKAQLEAERLVRQFALTVRAVAGTDPEPPVAGWELESARIAMHEALWSQFGSARRTAAAEAQGYVLELLARELEQDGWTRRLEEQGEEALENLAYEVGVQARRGWEQAFLTGRCETNARLALAWDQPESPR